MPTDIYSIYKITNLINGKIYIGFTKNPKRRWHQHSRSYKNPNFLHYPIYQAFSKYGIHNFSFLVIYQSTDQLHTLKTMEDYFIEKYKSLTTQNGYNICRGGSCPDNTGRIHSEKTRKKQSLARIGKTPWNKGLKGVYKASEETKQRMKNSMIGKKHPINAKSRICGKKHSSERIQKATLNRIKSRNYLITYPNGNVEYTKNLAEFCRNHNLLRSLMCKVASGERNHHNGFKIKKIS